MPQLKEIRREFHETAEALQRVLAAEQLKSGVDYVFWGSFADDGRYEIRITLRAAKHGQKD